MERSFREHSSSHEATAEPTQRDSFGAEESSRTSVRKQEKPRYNTYRTSRKQAGAVHGPSSHLGLNIFDEMEHESSEAALRKVIQQLEKLQKTVDALANSTGTGIPHEHEHDLAEPSWLRWPASREHDDELLAREHSCYAERI